MLPSLPPILVALTIGPEDIETSPENNANEMSTRIRHSGVILVMEVCR